MCVAHLVSRHRLRLCPATERLSEECFFRTPLAFVGQQALRWGSKGGKGGTKLYFDGDYVSVGTLPRGSTWAKNPLPRNDTDQTRASFPPKCEEQPGCGDASYLNRTTCQCSGMWGPVHVEIVDMVQIPHDLPAGQYVLGWRWDCEESNQIWASCSDVTIVRA